MDIKFVGEAETRSTATDAVDTDGTFMVYAIPRTAAVEVVILRNMSSKPVRLASEVQTRPIHAVCLGVGVLGEHTDAELVTTARSICYACSGNG